jgi:hypothetical protein
VATSASIGSQRNARVLRASSTGLGVGDWTLTMIPGAALSLAALGARFVFGLDGPSTTPLIIGCLIVFMFFNAGAFSSWVG